MISSVFANLSLRRLLSAEREPVALPRRAAAPTSPDALFLQWLAFAGLMIFSAVVLWQRNVWSTLIEADPTGITMMIIAIFTVSTIWCGTRIRRMARERDALHAWMQSFQDSSTAFANGPAQPHEGSYIGNYFQALLGKAKVQDYDGSHLADVLAERVHGPSETAWWVNGIQIKLGLLGKVIGFSILALNIAQMDSFDPAQSQNLLKSLTGGLGIALLTTAVGLVANILLGMQLVRLDRFGDVLLADTLEFVEAKLPAFLKRG